MPSRRATLSGLGPVTRLGLATRGNTSLECEAVLAAIDRGVNYLNWCGRPDGMQEAIRRLGPRRREVILAVQLEARSAAEAKGELDEALRGLDTERLDVVTYYYVEHREEWEEIAAHGGAAEALEAARREGVVGAIGLTSHQRPLTAEVAQSGRLDLLMVRYNAAHRGAEQDVFPLAQRKGLPVVTFTCTRWGALLKNTPDDPPGFVAPSAPECYRFVLAHPGVSVALMAPDGAEELEENLAFLDDWRALAAERYKELKAHGDRVRRWAGSFP
ncbi:MAG: aldo/keto reductase [Planctomycetes bacterium]|nr:aldo/keto reductase [Planctomycetota bacterium]